MKNNTNILLSLAIALTGMICAVHHVEADSLPDQKTLRVSENFDQGKIQTPGALALQAKFAPDDLGGQCLLLSKKNQRVLIPLASHFNPHVGTVEMRVRFTGDMKKAMGGTQYLFRAHAAGQKHGFFLLYGNWAKGLMFFLSDKNAVRTALYDKNASGWQSGQWHHIAITWDTRTTGHAELALYVDYQLVEKKQNITLPMDWKAWTNLVQAEKKKVPLPTQNMAIGNWGGKGAMDVQMAIDDFRIYDQQRQYLHGKIEAEIK